MMQCNKAIKVIPGRWPSNGSPCQGAAYGWRYIDETDLGEQGSET